MKEPKTRIVRSWSPTRAQWVVHHAHELPEYVTPRRYDSDIVPADEPEPIDLEIQKEETARLRHDQAERMRYKLAELRRELEERRQSGEPLKFTGPKRRVSAKRKKQLGEIVSIVRSFREIRVRDAFAMVGINDLKSSYKQVLVHFPIENVGVATRDRMKWFVLLD